MQLVKQLPEILHKERNLVYKQLNPETKLLLALAESIAVGEGIHVLKTEWPETKSGKTPGVTLQARMRLQKSQKIFSCRTLEDNSGWIITRLR